MNRTSKIADRIASGDMTLEVFPRYVRITAYISTERNDLKTYERELTVAASKVNGEAMRVLDELNAVGRRGKIRNIGITPKEGILGVVVEFDRALSIEETKQLNLS